MKTITRYLLFLLVALMSVSCAYKQYAKKAAKFEQQGQYQEASELYYQSLLKKSTYIESQMGLKRSGQRVIDKIYGDFMIAYNDGNNKQAVYYYIEAEKVEKKLATVKVELVVPPYYEEYYNEVKGSYLSDRYFEAEKMLTNKNYSGAEKIYREILKIDSDYKDSKDKLNIAVYEPKYQNAVTNMGNRKYRTAYYTFDDILKNYGNYKDCSDLKNESQKEATIKISIQNFKNHSTKSELDEQLKNDIIQLLNQENNPFIKIVEYQSSKSLISSGSQSRNAVKSIQSDAIIKGEILSFSYNMGKIKKTPKRGYLEVTTTYKDSEGESHTKTEYDKVSYNEYYMQRSVILKFNVSMIDTKTNQIVVSKSFNLTNKDEINYAKYEGNTKKLVPGYWKSLRSSSDEDVIKNSGAQIRELQSKLSARTKIKTYDALTNEIVNTVSSETVDKIIKYNPE
jgi:hypothetical protein